MRIVRLQSTRPPYSFWGRNICAKNPSCATLETYEETPIFIPVYITEESVKLAARKISGSSGARGMDLQALQGWILKSGDNSTRLGTRVETFVDWLANGSPPWVTYCEFMFGRLIALDKQPGVCLVGVGETWKRLFSNTVLKVTVSEEKMECQDEQLPKRIRDRKSVVSV